jgi:hypothetical protein
VSHAREEEEGIPEVVGRIMLFSCSCVNVAATIRLEPGSTKNSEGREVSMTVPVRTLLTQCAHGKSQDDEDGKPVRDFRGAWASACEAAKVPGLLFHDLRRTAERSLRRA